MINNYQCNLKQVYSVTVCFSPFTPDYIYILYFTANHFPVSGLSFMNFHQFQFGVIIKTEI